MTYVYILSDYGDDGAEHVTATLDRSYLPDMMRNNWSDLVDEKESGLLMYTKYLKQWLSGLDALLEKSDEELSSITCGWDCGDGYNGAQLHVVRLVGYRGRLLGR